MKRVHFSRRLKGISALLFVVALIGTLVFFVTGPHKKQTKTETMQKTISARETVPWHKEPPRTLKGGKSVYQKTRVYPYVLKMQASPFIIHETWVKLKAKARSDVWETEIRKEIVRDENEKVIWVKFVSHKYVITYAPELNLVKKRRAEPADQIWSHLRRDFYLAFAEAIFRENLGTQGFKKVGVSKIGPFRTDVIEQIEEFPVDVQTKPDGPKTNDEKGQAITRLYIDKESGLMRRFEESRGLGQAKVIFNRFDFWDYEILEPEEVSRKTLTFDPPDGAVLQQGEIEFDPFSYPNSHLSP